VRSRLWLGPGLRAGAGVGNPVVEGARLSLGAQPALQGRVAQALGERGEGFSPSTIVV
jgi:hypothetical protein